MLLWSLGDDYLVWIKSGFWIAVRYRSLYSILVSRSFSRVRLVSVSGFGVGLWIGLSGTVGIGLWFRDRSLDHGSLLFSGFGISLWVILTGTVRIGLWFRFGIGLQIFLSGKVSLWFRFGIGIHNILSGEVGIGL